MIRRLMASSAALALMTAGALGVAQAQTEPTDAEQPAVVQPDASATQDTTAPADQGAATTDTAEADSTLTPDEPTIATAFIGRSVFSSEDPESDTIGKVNDLIIGKDGTITHAVVGVGGFLGIGAKDVAVPFEELQVAEDEDGEIRLIYAATKEQLEAAEAFDRTAYDPRERAQEEQQAADAAAGGDAGGAMAPAPVPTDQAAEAPAIEEPATAEAPATEEPASDMAAVPATEQPAETAAPATDTAATDAPATDAPASTDTAEAPATGAEAPADQMADSTANTPAATDAAPADQMAAAGTAAEAEFLSFGADQVRASDVIGKEIFGPDDQSIGEVSDLVVQEDGETRAALIDIGGFLGVGEKEVSIPFEQIEMAQDGDEPRLTIAMSREELEALPAYEDETMGSEETAATDQPATTGSTGTDADAPAQDMATAGQNATGTAQDLTTATQDLSADELIGTAVYSPDEQNLGEVNDVVLDQAGAIEAVVIDVGGFLGVGEKPVAVQFDALNVSKDVNGDMRLTVNATQDQLKQAPAYQEEAPAQ
jgi:sporulation protein YlmC with PRC-barrel domain